MLSNEELGLRNNLADQQNEVPAVYATENQAAKSVIIGNYTVKYGSEMVDAVQLLGILNNVSAELEQFKGVNSRLRMEAMELSRQNDVLRAELEATDLSRLVQGLVRAEVEQQTEKYLESQEFQKQLDNRLEDLLDDALKNTSPDVGEAVEKAIEEALGNVRITFRN